MSNVNISRQNIDLIEGMIQSGEFENANDVINAALRKFDGDSHAKLIRLKQIIDDAFNSGEPEDFNIEEFLHEMRSDG